MQGLLSRRKAFAWRINTRYSSWSISGHDEEEVNVLDPKILRNAPCFSSFDELLKASPLNNKTWLAFFRGVLWCPRDEQIVQLRQINFCCNFSTSGLLLHNKDIKNPVTGRLTKVDAPDDLKCTELAVSAEHESFYLANFQNYSKKFFRLYSSPTKQWEDVPFPKLYSKSVAKVIGDGSQPWFQVWTKTMGFKLYNPLLQTWTRLPHPRRRTGCSDTVHFYKGRLYAMTESMDLDVEDDDDTFEIEVFVYLKAWKRINRTRARWIEDDHIVRYGAEGPYMCVSTLTFKSSAWVVVYDIDRNCWYFANMPSFEEVNPFTPSYTIGQTFLDSTY